MKKFYIFLFLCLLFTGCETTKGFSRGLGWDLKDTWQNIKEGSQRFAQGLNRTLKNTWQNIKEADQWFRENYW